MLLLHVLFTSSIPAQYALCFLLSLLLCIFEVSAYAISHLFFYIFDPSELDGYKAHVSSILGVPRSQG
jgi:hypothetical protein